MSTTARNSQSLDLDQTRSMLASANALISNRPFSLVGGRHTFNLDVLAALQALDAPELSEDD